MSGQINNVKRIRKSDDLFDFTTTKAAGLRSVREKVTKFLLVGVLQMSNRDQQAFGDLLWARHRARALR